MRNPYEVLGIKENATDIEIKKAYRELVKKYHPDRYRDNPLADLAEEKLREVNDAYETIMGKSGYKNGQSRQSNSRNDYGSTYDQVRNNINSGNYDQAEEILDSNNDGSAAWYYFKGLIFMGKGWHEKGISYLQRAVAMEPGNFEFRQALNRAAAKSGNYSSNPYYRTNMQGDNCTDNLCQVCACMSCADCFCNCC
jgi:molecular chaperone DnaJ